MKKSAGAFITYNKKLLMLLRDNNPDIADPNCWQLIGGDSEPGEIPTKTLIREVEEETNIQVRESTIEKIGRIIVSNEWEHYLYWVKLTKEQAGNFKLGNEGQDLKFVSMIEMDKLKLGKNLSEYCRNYKEGLKKLTEEELLDKKELGFDEEGDYCIKKHHEN